MERLIADANDVKVANGEMADLSISSFADMIEAIHIIQKEQGITGTTAKEAATTIQGSVNSMKAAWQNLIVGVADDNQDFDKLMDDFVDSVETAGDNIIPRVEKSLDGVAKLVEKSSEKLIPKAIKVVTRNLPKFINAGGKIIKAVASGITQNSAEILKASGKAFTALVSAASDTASDILRKAKSVAPQIGAELKTIAKEADGTVIAVGGIAGAIKSLAKGNYVGAAIGGVVAAIGLIKSGSDSAKDAIKGLSDEEAAYLTSASAAAKSFETILGTRKENITAIGTEMENAKKLWGELQTITDEQGKVQEGQEARASYILGELNKALGTEYEMNDGIIAQYGKMREEIDKLILKKRAERLLEASATAYDEAKASLTERSTAAGLAAEALANAQKNAATLKARFDALDLTRGASVGEYRSLGVQLAQAQKAVDEAQAEYDRLSKNAATAAETISAYEDAMRASTEQNYARVAEILERDTAYRWKHVGDIKKITDEEAEQLVSDWKNAERAASFYRSQYAKGAEGFTSETAADLETKAADLKKLIDEYNGVLGADTASLISKAGKTRMETQMYASTGLPTTTERGSATQQVNAFADELATKILDGMKGLKVELDTGKLVGGITNEMDKSLGYKYAYQMRGALA